MHARIAELVDYLASARRALLDAVEQVPAERRDHRPTAAGWSVGEVLDHLLMIEGGSARLLAKQLARAREAGLDAERETGSVIDGLRQYDIVGGPPREAPEMVRPREGARAAEALTGLSTSREALLGVLRDGDGLALGQVTARHAALGEIDLYRWMVFIAEHERRHERQIRQIAEALSGPVTATG